MRLARLGVVIVMAATIVPPAAAPATNAGVRSVSRQAARVTTAALEQKTTYSSISVVDGRLLLSGSSADSVDPEAADTCYTAQVDPASLTLSNERSGSCADPAVQGRHVLPVFAIDRALPAKGGGPTAVVRIAHLIGASPGYELGPDVMSFPSLAWSDSAPTWIYGGGDLWLYEWDNPGADLIRVSATTGKVLQRLHVPKVWHPILADNDEGLWIAASGQTDTPTPLYLVATGTTQAKAVFHFASNGFAKWIVASGDDVWVNAQPRPVNTTGVVWMLRGPGATPVWHIPESPKIASVFETLGGSGMVGDSSDGLWAAPPTGFGEQQVVRIGPASASTDTVVELKGSYLGSATSWTGTTLAGSFYLLDPAIPVEGRSNTLYRITPSR